MKNLIVSLLVLIFVMMSCTQAEELLNTKEKTGIESEISALVDTLAREWSNLDFDKFLSHYLLNDEFLYIKDTEIIIGKDNYLKFIEHIKEFIKEYNTYEYIEPHIFVHNRNLVSFISPLSETFISRNEENWALDAIQGFLFQKKDGAWKVIQVTFIHSTSE